MSYSKLTPNHPAYKLVEETKAAGQWVCDAVDHNEWYGCSNPECFKHKGQQERLKKTKEAR